MKPYGLLLIFIASMAQGQVVKVTGPGGETGMGVLVSAWTKGNIRYGHILTANHISNASILKVEYETGFRTKNCRVLARDSKQDIAVVWACVPDDVEPCPVSSVEAGRGDRLEFIGKDYRKFESTVSVVDDGNAYADVILLSGDSGGPALLNGKVCGIISGGHIWLGDTPQSWPARMSNAGPIRKLLSRLR